MHKALRTWSLSLVSGFNAELPLLKKTSYLHTFLSRKLHAELWVYVGKDPSLQSNLIERSLFLFLSPFPLLREGIVKNKCFNRSRGAIRDSQFKKKLEMMQTSLCLPGFGAGTAALWAQWKQPREEAGLWRVPLPPSPTLLFQPL